MPYVFHWEFVILGTDDLGGECNRMRECDPGYLLVNCGLRPIQASLHNEHYAQSIPVQLVFRPKWFFSQDTLESRYNMPYHKAMNEMSIRLYSPTLHPFQTYSYIASNDLETGPALGQVYTMLNNPVCFHIHALT